jgi:predicted ATPase
MRIEPVEASKLTEVRLTAFKSYKAQSLPIDDLTVIVGRNGSGKSNALDGLWVLARLASGEDLREALDGSREGPQVRGGASGCVPSGTDTFSLGCSVQTGSEVLRFDVTIRVNSTVQVVTESLTIAGEKSPKVLLQTLEASPDSSDIQAKWQSKPRGAPTHVAFRANRLLVTQVPGRIPATEAGLVLHRASAQLLSALKAAFVLDPVPHAMRTYVNEHQVVLRRDASNISPAIGHLIATDPEARERFVDSLDDLHEQSVIDVAVETSNLRDTILIVTEGSVRKPFVVSAAAVSDGTLRFLAILTALWQAPNVSSKPSGGSALDPMADVQLVIEELENGLHSSQASTLIGRIREAVQTRQIRVLATVHSPTVLDALKGSEHQSVVVCTRDANGNSTLKRLSEFSNYLDIALRPSLGAAATEDQLRETPEPDVTEALARLDAILGKAS